MTPEYEAMRRRNQLAIAMMGQNRVNPNNGPWSALANLGQTLAGAYMTKRFGDEEKSFLDAQKQRDNAALVNIMAKLKAGDYGGAMGDAQNTSDPSRYAPLVQTMMAQGNRAQDREWQVSDRDQSRVWAITDAATKRAQEVADMDRNFGQSKEMLDLQTKLQAARDDKKRSQEVEDRDLAIGVDVAKAQLKAKQDASPGNATGDERLSAGFLSRMDAAEKALSGLTANGFEPTSTWERLKSATNFTASPEYQQYQQAADDWIRAKLRKESGAVIDPEEMAKEYEVYFPQPGDSAEVIAQKAQARAQASYAMQIAAGKAAPLASSPVSVGSDIQSLIDKYAPGAY